MTADPYNGVVRRHFAAPRYAGAVDGGAEARVDDQGVRIRLTAAHAGGRIEALRFQAWGCPHLLAACDAFCGKFEGQSCAELLEFSAADLMQSLAVPVEKTGRILVLEDAVRSLGTAVCGPPDPNN